jgi:hypothetical protein
VAEVDVAAAATAAVAIKRPEKRAKRASFDRHAAYGVHGPQRGDPGCAGSDRPTLLAS